MHYSLLIVVGAMLALAVLALAIAFIMPGIDPWSKEFFIVFHLIIILSIVVSFADLLVYGNPSLVLLERISSYLGYLVPSLLPPLLTAYLLHCCGEDWKKSPVFYSVLFIWIVYFMILFAAQFTDRFYYITPENLFFRGPWHPLLFIPPVVIQMISLIVLIQRRRRLSGKYFSAFLIYLIPLTVATMIHAVVEAFFLFDLSICICTLAMYNFILSDQIEQYMRQQQEIAHQRSSIMVLQMRPHFIYNTMMSIYYLCKQNPDLAQKVTLDFTTYLRKNFTAISSEELIPFSEELEHARAYLAVEQAQFEDTLFVDYDTPHKDFLLPPLTLQPIVENSIKHGMDPDSDPLHISIRTRKTDSGSEITVEDNGTGFDPGGNNEPHIALDNIQQRLNMMCRGKMTITANNKGGTMVKITIP